MSSRHFGQDVSNFVKIKITEDQHHLINGGLAQKLWDIFPTVVMNRDVNVSPVNPKFIKFSVSRRFVVPFFTVATNTGGLVIPVCVRALLALRNDVVTVHQDQVAFGRLTKKINVSATALVLPGDQTVPHSTTTNTLATMNGERLEVGHTKSVDLAGVVAHQALAE